MTQRQAGFLVGLPFVFIRGPLEHLDPAVDWRSAAASRDVPFRAHSFLLVVAGRKGACSSSRRQAIGCGSYRWSAL